MRKCPRCEHEISDNEKFCPHCGLDLEGKYRPIQKKNPISKLIYFGLFLLCMSIPLIYSFLLNNIGNDIEQLNSKQVKLEDMKDESPTAILETYTTLADFKNQFTNVDTIVSSIENYEKSLVKTDNVVFDKEYSISVLDNYNIYYTLTYTTKINDQIEMSIIREYDRAHKSNEETITFKKTGATDFESLLLSDEEMKIVKSYTGDENVTSKLIDAFSKRKTEFDEKKEKLGHYGLGNYDGKSSFVVYRKGSTYYSELKYSHDVSDYIN